MNPVRDVSKTINGSEIVLTCEDLPIVWLERIVRAEVGEKSRRRTCRKVDWGN